MIARSSGHVQSPKSERLRSNQRIGGHIRKLKRIVAVLLAAAALALLSRFAGSALIINRPEQVDVIVVLGGDHNDVRYRHGLELWMAGQGQILLVDANSDEIQFGETLTSQTEDFIKRTARNTTDNVRVCPIEGDSTVREAEYVSGCLQPTHAARILLVTSAFHTRRALSIFRQRLPQYRWSVVAVPDETRFNERWWRRREWAKTTFIEWTKMLWWEAVDRWRS